MKFKVVILSLIVLFISGCSANQESTYVCDYSQYFNDYEKVEIEVNLTYKDEDLLAETNIQRFWFFNTTSSYQKEYLIKDIHTFEDEGYKVELKEYDDYYEVITTIDYENLSEDYQGILLNTDGRVPLQESIDFLEANSCILQ